MKFKTSVFLFIFYLFAISQACASNENSHVKKGNFLYKEGDFDSALQAYLQGLEKHPDSTLLNFNSGDAFYMKEDFQKSKDQFHKATQSENKLLESKASYNIGNSLFKEAVSKEKNDMSLAIQLLKEALQYYQRAIELDQKDSDAKYNYEITSKKIKILLEEQKNNKTQKQKNEQQRSNEQKQQEEQTNEKTEKQKNNPPEEQKNEQQELNNSSTQEPNSSSGEEKKMTPEEARMLVDSYSREGKRLELKDKHDPTQDKEVDKDW